MKLNRLLPLILLPVVLANVACSPGRSPAGDITPVRIGHFPNLTHAPALLIRERGGFEQSLSPRPVVWHHFSAGPEAVEALFAGELDLLYVGPGPAINGFVKSGGRELRVLAGATANGAGLVVRSDANILSPKDLAGKRLATPQPGNTQDIALRNHLLGQELKWAERGGTVRVLSLPGADQLALWQRGEIDGAWAVEPWLSRLEIEGPGKLLVDEKALWPEGRHPTTLLVAHPAFLEKRADAASIALAVHRRAVAELAAGDPAARRAVESQLLKLTGKPLPPAVLAAAWDRLVFTDDPMTAALHRSAEHAAALGFLPAGADLKGLVADPRPAGDAP